MSLLDPLACGFAKCFVYKTLLKDANNIKSLSSKNDVCTIYKRHCDEFNNSFFTFFEHVSYERYKNFIKIKDTFILLRKNSVEKRDQFVETFSLDNFKSLKFVEKKKHSLFDCNGCLKNSVYKQLLSFLPIGKKSFTYKRKAAEAGLYDPPVEADKLIPLKVKEQVLREAKKDAEKQIEGSCLIRLVCLY